MSLRGFRAVLMLVFFVIIPCTPAKRVHAQAPPTLEQIIVGLESMEKSFFEGQSLLIRYELTGSHNVAPSSYSGKFELAEFTLAYRGEKWFSERRFTHPYKTKEFMVPTEPKTQIIKERFLIDWDKDSKTAAIDKFKEGRNIFQGLFFTRNLSLDAPKYIAKSNGADISSIRKKKGRYDASVNLPFLPDFLRNNKSHYKVLPIPQRVDDTPCWIVEWSGMDKFWVDPRRGFVIPRRIFCWEPGGPRRYEFRQSDYREVKAGLWLPFIQNEDRYADITAENESLWGKVTAQSKYRVHSIEFDRLPDGFFEISLPPETRVIDMVREFQYTVSDNTDPFIASMAEAKKIQRRSLLIWLSLGGAALTVVVFLIYWLRDRYKTKNDMRAP